MAYIGANSQKKSNGLAHNITINHRTYTYKLPIFQGNTIPLYPLSIYTPMDNIQEYELHYTAVTYYDPNLHTIESEK